MRKLFGNTTDISPEDFEIQVQNFIKVLGDKLKNLDVKRREKILGSDGEYEIDVLASFEAFGARFVVLIECKHHKNPIKRDIVQILNDRLRSVGAQKGMIFATCSFQTGAINYAKKMEYHSLKLKMEKVIIWLEI